MELALDAAQVMWLELDNVSLGAMAMNPKEEREEEKEEDDDTGIHGRECRNCIE